MAFSADVGRRVIQCACGRTAQWRGEDAAAAAGWRGAYVRDSQGFATTERRWSCPDCHKPAIAAPSPFFGGLPSYLRDQLEFPKSYDLVREHLERIRVENPVRFAACVTEIATFLEPGPGGHLLKPGIRKRWAAYVRASKPVKRGSAGGR